MIAERRTAIAGATHMPRDVFVIPSAAQRGVASQEERRLPKRDVLAGRPPRDDRGEKPGWLGILTLGFVSDAPFPVIQRTVGEYRLAPLVQFCAKLR
jgi:hypothetical protein